MRFISTHAFRNCVLALSLAAGGGMMLLLAGAGPIRLSKVLPLTDAQTVSVTISGYKFDPQTLEVKAGTTVTWTNQDAKDHTVSSGTPDEPKSGLLDGDLDGQGKTYSYTFKEPGEFPYYCKNHRAMRGKVIVK